jgi:hypothetical protein
VHARRGQGDGEPIGNHRAASWAQLHAHEALGAGVAWRVASRGGRPMPRHGVWQTAWVEAPWHLVVHCEDAEASVHQQHVAGAAGRACAR